MVVIANLFLKGENPENVRVLSLQGNEIIIELEMPVRDDKTYQIQINENRFNLEFTQIDVNFEKNQKIYCRAKGFIF